MREGGLWRSEGTPAATRRVRFGGPSWEEVVGEAVSILGQGGVIAIPTDTVYGLAASIHRPDGLARLYAVKGRPEDRPLPVLLAETATISAVAGDPPERMRQLLGRFWPGGLTVALPALSGVKPPLCASDGTVGVRVPDHAVTRALLRAAGGALAVTSANVSGEGAAANATDIGAELRKRIDLIIDGGEAPGGEASTVIGIEQDRLQLHRQGVIPFAILQRCWEEIGRQLVAAGPGTVG